MLAGLPGDRPARAVADALVASGAFTADLRLPADRWFRWKPGIRGTVRRQLPPAQRGPRLALLAGPRADRFPQVLASAQRAGVVTAADVTELLRFYADPRRHCWRLPG